MVIDGDASENFCHFRIKRYFILSLQLDIIPFVFF